MKTREQIAEELNVRPQINVKEEIRTRIDFLKAYLKKTGAKGFVLGISGGQDSTLAGRLAQLAVEELRAEGVQATFAAVRLPYGIQKDEADAQLALQFIAPDQAIVYRIEAAVDAFAEQFNAAMKQPISDFNKGNAKARVRMMAQYAIAGEMGLLVIGTDHAAEAVTGFFTKYGDGGADILPLAGLTKRQGRLLLQELQAPERLYLKTPTADLLDHTPQQADETELGMTYEQIDHFLEGKAVDAGTKEKLEKRYAATQHKRELPVSPADTWWE